MPEIRHRARVHPPHRADRAWARLLDELFRRGVMTAPGMAGSLLAGAGTGTVPERRLADRHVGRREGRP